MPDWLKVLPFFAGETSVLRAPARSFLYSRPYVLDSSRVDYPLARELYRNTREEYKLGAAFARPVVNTCAGFIGVPAFSHEDAEADRALELFVARHAGKLLRVNRDMLRDGDCFVRLGFAEGRFGGREVPTLDLIPPEWVRPLVDPLTGEWTKVIVTYPIEVVREDSGRAETHTVTETWTAERRAVEVDARAPAELRARSGDEVNPWGFIPIVHFKNEAEGGQLYGSSEIEPFEPFMKAYHDTMLFAVQGSKLFSRPKAKFKLKNVQKFLEDNFEAQEVAAGKLRFADKELFLLQEGDDVAFVTADSGFPGASTLLEFLFYCIVDVSETPEFAFGTAVASSKASVSEQMVPLARKIRRKRGQMEEFYTDLASMFLAMRSKIENRRLDTYEVNIAWDELSPKDDQEVAQTIKVLVEGLVTAVESDLLSVDAASEFLREFIPTMLPYLDPDAADDERRRVAKSMLWRKRIDEDSDLA